jgi:hypothetical protein
VPQGLHWFSSKRDGTDGTARDLRQDSSSSQHKEGVDDQIPDPLGEISPRPATVVEVLHHHAGRGCGELCRCRSWVAAPKSGGGSADLVLDGHVAEGSTAEGVEFIFGIYNNGPANASSVKLTDSFDAADLEFVSAQSSQSVTCNGGSGSQTCELGSLQSGSSTWVALSFRRRTSEGTTVSTASVSSTTKDPDPANNTKSLTIPLHFVVGCTGYAQALSVRSYSFNRTPTCTRSFTLSAPRTVVLQLKPEPGYTGLLEASLSWSLVSETSLLALMQERIAAVYSTDGTSSGITSKTVTLTPGTWRLTVGTREVGAWDPLPGPRCISFPRLPSDWCSPDPLEAAGVYIPAGFGTYGGQVIDPPAAG